MNTIIVTCFAVAIVTAVSDAYDFTDSYYNVYLADELNDLYAEEVPFLNPRNRRDEEAVDMEKCRRRFRPKVCCGEEVFAELHHSDEKRECFREIVGKDKDTSGPPPDPFKCEGRGKFRKNMMCVMNCVAKKKNLIDDDGNIKEDAIKSLFKSKFTDPAWTTELQDKIISTCMNEAKNPPPMPKDDANEQNECNPSLMVFSHCLFKEVQMQCPNEVITDQKSCERFRERVKNGDDMMPPPPPPMDD